MKGIQAAVAVFLIASAAAAQAQTQNEMDGNELLEQCERAGVPGRFYCTGYMIGVAQMFNETGMYGVNTCPPAPIPQEQIVDIVLKQLKANPEDRHIGARYLISGALARAFPCRK